MSIYNTPIHGDQDLMVLGSKTSVSSCDFSLKKGSPLILCCGADLYNCKVTNGGWFCGGSMHGENFSSSEFQDTGLRPQRSIYRTYFKDYVGSPATSLSSNEAVQTGHDSSTLEFFSNHTPSDLLPENAEQFALAKKIYLANHRTCNEPIDKVRKIGYLLYSFSGDSSVDKVNEFIHAAMLDLQDILPRSMGDGPDTRRPASPTDTCTTGHDGLTPQGSVFGSDDEDWGQGQGPRADNFKSATVENYESGEE